MKVLRSAKLPPCWVILSGLSLYLVLFFATRLPSLEAGGSPFRRVDYFWLLLLPENLVGGWFGDPPECSLLDRLPVAATAGMIVACAAGLGRLLLALLRADRGLTRLEVLAFSTAAGLNALSTATLLVGLAGLLGHPLVFLAPAAGIAVAAAWFFARRVIAASPRAGLPGKEGRRADRGQRALKAPGPGGSPAGRTPRTSSAPGGPTRADRAAAAPWLGARWLWLGAPFTLVILLGGMLPPIDFDVREYHLQVPKEFYQQGSVGFLPHNVYGNMPMGAEMHSLLAMALTGDWWLGALAGKTVIALLAPLTALGLFAAGRRLLGTTAGTVAAVVYISVPWIVHVSAAGLVDGAVACYLFLAAYALLLWRDQRPRNRPAGPPHPARQPASACPGRFSHLLLAGYLAGAAAATKYPAVLFVVVPLTLAVLIQSARKLRPGPSPAPGGSPEEEPRPESLAPGPGKESPPDMRARGPQEKGAFKSFGPGPRQKSQARWSGSYKARGFWAGWVSVALFLLAAGTGCGVWFAKNWVLTGNPTYPLLYRVFGGRNWTAEKDARWNRAHRPRWPEDFSIARLAGDAGRVLWRSPWLSPLVMPLAALGLLPRRKRRKGARHSRSGHPGRGTDPANRGPPVQALAAHFGFVIATWWCCTHRIDRFWIPALPLACLLAGIGACWSQGRPWRYLLGALLACGLVWNFLVASSPRPGAYHRFFVGLDRLRHHPERVDRWQRYFNRNCRGGRVLMVGVADVFDMEVPVLYNTVFDDCLFERLVRGRGGEAIRRVFAERGITHVFVHWGEIARYRSPGNYGFTDFVQPEVLDRLVAEGVLEPLGPLGDHPGRAYRVLGRRR